MKVLGAEPETAAPYALSLREGGPRKFSDWQASFVDGAGGKSVTERMWQRMRPVTDGAITVTLEQTRDAMRLIAEKRGRLRKARARFLWPRRSPGRRGRTRRLRRFRRQHRPRQVRRAGDDLEHSKVKAPGRGMAARQAAIDHQRGAVDVARLRRRRGTAPPARSPAGSPPRFSGLISPMPLLLAALARSVVHRLGHARSR